ncbi:MAG: ABC transporter ATP-binding protein/permease [Lachnospiraceae bacterium]|nr:ABC transporter ATP-binding protein/permease [Lachnospiraceae bacterium]
MWKYLKKYLFFAILAPLFMIGEVSMDLIQPSFMSTIVDEGVLGLSNGGVGDLSIVLNTGLKMILCVVIGGSCGVLCGVFSNLCAQNFGNDMRKDAFRRIMSLSFEQTDQFSTGSLVTRTTNDITQIQNMIQQCIWGFIRQLVFMVGGVACMISMDISFGIIALCAFPFLIVCIVFFLSKITPFFSILQEKLDHVNSVMQENVAGARVVKAYVREDYETDRFGKANQDLVDTQLHILLLLSYMTPIMNIVLNIAVVAVIYVGSIRVQTVGVTPGNIMAAITYLTYILNSVMMFAMIFQSISRGMASWRRIKEVLDCEPVIADGTSDAADVLLPKPDSQETDGSIPDSGQNLSETGRVELRHVSFAYPGGSGEQVLTDINLTIEPGETLALLGATGSGKSSLVNLIPRFYDATEGEVLVDGRNVKDYRVSELRDRIAIALQKSELFSKTIRENISWGCPGASDEEILAAARAAQATEFIFSKPEGLDTMVAEKGMSLSGGQKQRLSISRALLKRSEILIFDDSTSALDLKTEAKLYEALRTTYQDVTKIIIAQRIASVRGADRIAVIDNGRIVACAPHEELMKSCELYQDIYRSQLKEGGEIYGE